MILTLNSNGGTITVDSTIGNSVAVKAIDINSTGGAGDITLNGIGNGTTTAGNAGQVDIGNAATDQLKLAGTFFTNGQTTYTASGTANAGDENIEITATTTFKTSNDALIFATAAIDIADGANLTIDTGTGAITLTDIHGDGTTDTTDIDIDGGAISVKSIGQTGAKDEINGIDINGSGGITLNGSIFTAGTDTNVGFTGAVSLATGDIPIDTSTSNGTVDFSSTLDGTQNLDILSGSGQVTITGNIGTSNALTSLDINQTAGTGNIRILGNIGTDNASGAGIVRLGNDSNTGTITFGTSGTAGDYFTTGAQTYIADGYSLVGTDPDFNASSENIDFQDGDNGMTLAAGSDLTVDTGSGEDGNINIEAAIASTSGETTDVTLEAGSGTVVVYGMATGIGDVTIDGSGGITLNGNITTNGSNIDINDATSLATAHIALTTAGGSVDFAATTGTINSAAAKNLTINSGTGNVFLRSIVGGANAIGNLTINATSASHTGDGDITVFEIGGGSAGAATVNIGNVNTDDLNLTGDVYNAGAQTYTAEADAAGNIDLTEGGGDIVFTTNGNNIAFNTGTIALSDGSDLSVSAGAGDITVYGIVGGSAGAGEDVTLDSTTGTVTLGAGGITGTGIEDVSIDADGGGAGVIVLQGDITTTGTGTGGSAEVGDVDFDGPVKIDGAITITTDVGGSGSTENDGKIDFGSNTINSANTGNDTESLTLLSGSGSNYSWNNWCYNTSRWFID